MADPLPLYSGRARRAYFAAVITYVLYSSPLGELTILLEDGAVIGLCLPKQPTPAAEPAGAQDAKAVLRWLDAYFAGKNPPIDFPLKPSGTPFQQSVWNMLRQIPYGTAASYGTLAKQFPKPMSAQAVGQAVGKNPIPILIPCHRVLGRQNALTGYAGGLDAKKFLLTLEHIPFIR